MEKSFLMNRKAIFLEAYSSGPTDAVGAPRDFEGKMTADARNRLETAISELVDYEAPIEMQALIRKIGSRFGYKRLPEKVRDEIVRHIPNDMVFEDGHRSFVWPKDKSPASWRIVRSSTAIRKITEIPTAELANAIVFVAINSTGKVSRTQVFQDVLRIFGLSRLTPTATSFLTEALRFASSRGDLIDNDEVIELAKLTDPTHSGNDIVFKRWELEPAMSISALINNQRRGIYVLEFEDGSRYVGQSVNVVNRFATHVHGSTHHKGWTDVVAIQFREMPVGDLNEAEYQEIVRQKSLGFELRNKVFNLGHKQPSKFDDVVTVEEQHHWALGHGNYELANLDQRLSETPSAPSKLKSQVPSLVSDAIYLAVLDDLAYCLSNIVPDAVKLESTYWTISDSPSTSGGRFATLNVGALELAYFPRILVDDPEGLTEEQFQVVMFNLPADVLKADWEAAILREDDYWILFERIPYALINTVRAVMPIGCLREFFDSEPELLADARQFAINLMRQGGSGKFRRWHSKSLTYEVFAHCRQCNEDTLAG